MYLALTQTSGVSLPYRVYLLLGFLAYIPGKLSKDFFETGLTEDSSELHYVFTHAVPATTYVETGESEAMRHVTRLVRLGIEMTCSTKIESAAGMRGWQAKNFYLLQRAKTSRDKPGISSMIDTVVVPDIYKCNGSMGISIRDAYQKNRYGEQCN